ncbi:MAG: leucyl/phenylalanyl-tRNA--protein transferase [Paracoccaceae bacterium]
MKDELEITPALLVQAYRAGVFPMAEDASSDELFWVDPPARGIIPIDGFHASRSLKKRINSGHYSASRNQCFSRVIAECAKRDVTWINPQITALYTALHHQGMAHSQEIWRDGALVGGVYGLAIGGAFFGESMFSRATDGSKLALYALISHLRGLGFTLFDTQFITPHLASLGGVEITRARYHRLLESALAASTAAFTPCLPYPLTQEMTQMS